MIQSTTIVEAALELIDVEHVALTKRAPLPDHRTIGFAASPKVRTPDTAQKYREEAKLIFDRIEQASVMTAEVRLLCDEMRKKIEHPSQSAGSLRSDK